MPGLHTVLPWGNVKFLAGRIYSSDERECGVLRKIVFFDQLDF